MRIKRQVTLRIPHPLHLALKKDAKSQGVTLNSYILSSVQRERATRDAALDSVDMNEVAKDISAARDEISALMGEFKSIESIIKDQSATDEQESPRLFVDEIQNAEMKKIEPGLLEWRTIILGFIAIIMVGGLIPFWLFIYYSINR